MSTPGKRGAIDGGFGSGVPLGGRDERPPTGYRIKKSDEWTEDESITDAPDLNDFDDPDESDRRRDPLRK